ncbi:triple helix repeat-containing collagen, partial [Clostridium carboxidivorans P7]
MKKHSIECYPCKNRENEDECLKDTHRFEEDCEYNLNITCCGEEGERGPRGHRGHRGRKGETGDPGDQGERGRRG